MRPGRDKEEGKIESRTSQENRRGRNMASIVLSSVQMDPRTGRVRRTRLGRARFSCSRSALPATEGPPCYPTLSER